MYVLHAYEKRKENFTGATGFQCGWPLPEDSNVISLIFLCDAIRFIETWINNSYKSIAWRCLAH